MKIAIKYNYTDIRMAKTNKQNKYNAKSKHKVLGRLQGIWNSYLMLMTIKIIQPL